MLEIFKNLVISTSYLVVAISMIPLIRKDYWFFRVFEYPRIQKLIVNFFLLFSLIFFFRIDTIHDKVITGLLVANMCYLIFQVYPFTIVGNKQLIKLPSGNLIQFHGLHPTPPVPNENPRSTERDKEILMIAKTAKKSKIPVIVAGDLNDVAWSYTTELFSKTSGLLDPRKGRGYFNTFHAKYLFLRFPLDHIFCSNDFTLLDIQRMPNYGSDHFPMYIKLQYSPEKKAVQEKPEADQDDLQKAEEKINKLA